MIERDKTGFTICPLSEALLPQAAGVYLRTFNEVPWNEDWSLAAAMQRLGELSRTPGYLGLVLRDGVDGAVVALAIGCFESWDQGRVFQLKELCVQPGLQDNGLGKQLLRAATEAAFAQGAQKIYLHTQRGGVAEQFYLNEGFSESKVVLELLAGTVKAQKKMRRKTVNEVVATV